IADAVRDSARNHTAAMDAGQAVQPPERRRRLILATALAAWAVVTLTAFGWLWAYDSAPGPQRPAPSTTRPTRDHHALLPFLHPKCPCSRATLSELARLTARAEGPLDVRVLFVFPGGADDGWRHTPLYATAAAIPGVWVSPDPGGVLARRYGA